MLAVGVHDGNTSKEMNSYAVRNVSQEAKGYQVGLVEKTLDCSMLYLVCLQAQVHQTQVAMRKRGNKNYLC